MTTTQATILGGLIASPLLISVFEWVRNKISARFIYRGWQAVFLRNGQTYFGKITSISKNEISLKKIYYIDGPTTDIPGQPLRKGHSFELTKLGEKEVHGPKDHMMINRSGISFIENLEDSGEVVFKILKHKQKD